MTDDAELPPTRQLSWVPLGGAFAIVVAIVVLTLVLGGGENKGAPSPPRVDAKGALLCPDSYRFEVTKTWVPNDPIGVNVATGLVPDESPEQVVVCRYAAPTTATATVLPKTGRVVLGGDLDRVRSALGAAKTRPGDTLEGVAYSSKTVYLIGLTYSDGTLWVSVGTTADGNGKSVTTENLTDLTAAAYRAKRWP